MINIYAFHIKKNMASTRTAAKGATDRSEVGGSSYTQLWEGWQIFMEEVIYRQVRKVG